MEHTELAEVLESETHVDMEKLAEQLQKAQKAHAEDLSYVPEGLYRLLASGSDLTAPLDWGQAETAVEEAMRALEARQEGGLSP